jgi:sulfur-oxidizing protein SoxA
MRFPDARLLLAGAALVASQAFAAADAAKNEITSRLQKQLPDVPAADYALGSAAFDAQLRAELEQNAAAGAGAVEAGRSAWNAKFRDGRTLAACFPNGGRRIAAHYPQYDARLKRVVTLEMAINQCLKSHGEAPYDPVDPKTMGVVTAYLRSLSNGQKVAVRVPPAAEDRFEQGRRLYFTRLGQRNYACASCHLQGAGKRFGEAALSPPVGQATHWPVIRDGVPVTLQARIRECLELMGAAPFAAGSDELNHLEYFLTYLSGGLAMKANPWRPAKEPAPSAKP